MPVTRGKQKEAHQSRNRDRSCLRNCRPALNFEKRPPILSFKPLVQCLRFQAQMKYRLFVLSLALGLLASCSTPYQPMSLLGGYQELRLAPDIYRVAFFGNGYTNPQLTVEYALRRCAEVTQQSGYRYFGILDVRDLSVQRSWTTPASAYTTGNLSVNSFGNTAY
jgi:hypothetical protein